MKYRKKPVEIEAFQLTPDLVCRHIIDEEPLPFGIRISHWNAHPERREVYGWRLFIPTLEGTMEAKESDWIIRGIKGELYPCRADIFAATYDPVEGN